MIYETRELLAELFHAPGPDRVAFTANSTESLNMAIKGVVRPGDRVAVTALEHNSVLRPLYQMEAEGAVLEIAAVWERNGLLGIPCAEKDFWITRR